jgi:cyclopropane fatty-acyl-phospholipid synthase-like methyltransferase
MFMDYFDKKENVENYIRIAQGYDGTLLIDKLKKYLTPGSSVLEIGIGPGKDLDILSQTYQATGSDRSELFLTSYRQNHRETDILNLDAITLQTDRKFDALYSNKVLHCLNYGEMTLSFNRQAQLLKQGGLILHSFWYGQEVEVFENERYYQVTEDKLLTLMDNRFEPVEMGRYKEMETNDSLFALFRLT